MIVRLRAPVGEDRALHAYAWLRRALRDVGIHVGGYGWGFDTAGRPYSLDVGDRHDPKVVRQTIEGLWANERPGFPVAITIVALPFRARPAAPSPPDGESGRPEGFQALAAASTQRRHDLVTTTAAALGPGRLRAGGVR